MLTVGRHFYRKLTHCKPRPSIQLIESSDTRGISYTASGINVKSRIKCRIKNHGQNQESLTESKNHKENQESRSESRIMESYS